MSDAHQDSEDRRVIYVPLRSEVIQDYVCELCDEFGEHNADFNLPKIQAGLAGFLIFVSGSIAKYLDAGHSELLLTYQAKNHKEVHHAIKEI